MTGEVEQPITRRQHSVSPAGIPDAGSRRLLDGPPDLSWTDHDRRVVASLPVPTPERLRELAAVLLAHAQQRAS
jgi:hypothetical protein